MAETLTGNPKVLAAARVQFDFWDTEDGYYQNGTYYGDKNVLALGGATQVQSGHTASTIDFLLEKKVGKRRGVYDRKRVCGLQQAGRVRCGVCKE